MGRLLSRRWIHQVPFHDDLTPVDEDYFNLGDFKKYKEAPDVRKLRQKLGDEPLRDPQKPESVGTAQTGIPNIETALKGSFSEACLATEPVIFASRLSDPFLNLAVEDYIYNQMPLPEDHNCNRLMFYVNSPCVVIGKNQNPWQEVNMPLLNSLKIPLVRRRSGGGTVVHDTGNVNYSFMTTKANFDRFTFANLVKTAINKKALKKITVNERGDIVTEIGKLKVSGSAYKLSKGKSYHHGTMLLNLKLEVLRQLLHRDEAKVGTVTAAAAVPSVKSPVTNLELSTEDFIESVSNEFKEAYGLPLETSVEDEFDQTELLGLSGFVLAFSERGCKAFVVDESTQLPEEIENVRNLLVSWDWKYGSTTKFTHTLTKDDVTVSFNVKKGVLESFEVDSHKEAFEFLELVLARGDVVKYTGSDVAGFVTDDEVSEWVGESIDGTS